MTAADAEEKSEAEMRELIELFSKSARRRRGSRADSGSGRLLDDRRSRVRAGIAELVAIEEFDEDIVEELRSRARDVLLTQAIVQEEKIDEVRARGRTCWSLEGVDKGLAYTLASKGVVTREDLAELATDDLLEISRNGRRKCRRA